MTRILGRTALAFAVLCAAGCADSDDGVTPPPESKNTAPTVEIRSPDPTTEFSAGAGVSFTAEASDAEDGPLTGSAIVWESESRGVIGSGLFVDGVVFPAGEWVVVVVATDSQGALASDTIRITVAEVGENATVATGMLDLPAESASPSEYVIETGQGTAGVGQNGSFAVPVADDAATLIGVSGPSGELEMLAIAPAGSGADVSPRSTALALIAYYDGMPALSDVSSYLEALDADARMASLVRLLESTISEGASLASRATDIRGILESSPSSGPTPSRAYAAAGKPSVIPYEDIGIPGIEAEVVGARLRLRATTPVSYAVRVFTQNGEPVRNVQALGPGGYAIPTESGHSTVQDGTFVLPGASFEWLDFGADSQYVVVGEPFSIELDLPFQEEFDRYTVIARSARRDALDPMLVAGEWEGMRYAAFRQDYRNQVLRILANGMGAPANCFGAFSAVFNAEFAESMGAYADFSSLPAAAKLPFLSRVVDRLREPQQLAPVVGDCSKRIRSTPFYNRFFTLLGIVQPSFEVPAALAHGTMIAESRPRFDTCLSLALPTDVTSERKLSSYRCLELDLETSLATNTNNVISSEGTPVPLRGTVDAIFVARPVVPESAREISCAETEITFECAAPRANVSLEIQESSLEREARFWERGKSYFETGSTRTRRYDYDAASPTGWRDCDDLMDFDEKGHGCQRILLGSEGTHKALVTLADELDQIMDTAWVRQEAASDPEPDDYANPNLPPDWQPWAWNGYDKFPSLYFAAEPEGHFSDEQMDKISRFSLAILEFRMGQFSEEFTSGKWAGGDLAGFMDTQVTRFKSAHPDGPPMLVYRSGLWAGSMYKGQWDALQDQSLFVDDSRLCDGFISYPMDVDESGFQTDLENCRWDFTNPRTQEVFTHLMASASQEYSDGVFFDNAHSFACDESGEYSSWSKQERAAFMEDQAIVYARVFSALVNNDKYPILSTTNGFSDIGAQVPWESDCPVPEEDTIEALAGIPFARNNEFWMWNLGELASTQIRNTIRESQHGVPVIVHMPYFPDDGGCLEGCRRLDGTVKSFTESEFLEFGMAAFLVSMGPGSYFGFSNMQNDPELAGWGDMSWEYYRQYDTIVTGEPRGEVEISSDGMTFTRTFEHGTVWINVADGTYSIDLDK